MYAFLLLVFVLVRTDSTSSECWCVATDATLEDRYLLKSVPKRPCQCPSTFVRKCCDRGFYLEKAYCVRESESVPFEVQVYDQNVPLDIYRGDFVVGHMNCKSYVLDPNVENTDVFYIQRDGSMLLGEEKLDANNYCVENITGKGFSGLVCFQDEVEVKQLTRHFNSISMIISMPFLLATFLVYAILPDRNLHGKALMCYVMSLLIAYIFLVAIQLHAGYIQDIPCATVAYICYFAFMASFFWMNVMCIDLWWTFSGFRGFKGSKRSETRRFRLYSAYAWGMPVLIVIAVLTISYTIDENSKYHPRMGKDKCWVADGLATLLYFYGIMAVLIVLNIICFVLTALKIRKAKQDTAMLHKDESKRHSYENDTQRFNLYLKLLLAMGVNWSMEVISWAVEWKLSTVPTEVWIVTDFCNALYGVFIFIIFVCNKEKFKRLQKWYYTFTGRAMLAQSLTTSTNQTRPTHTASERSTTTESISLANHGINNPS